MPNSASAIAERVVSKQITWAGPLILTVARTFLLFASQALVALVFLFRHNASPWRAAGAWWTIYGTLVDIGCLLLLAKFTRGEGIRLRDLVGRPKLRYGRDIFVGLGYFLAVFPLFLFAPVAGNWLVYGTIHPPMYPGIVVERVLPLWAIVYSLSFWWFIWSPTEEATYQGYALPRVVALTGRTWVAVLLVGFWWAFQHAFLPFIPDWKFVLSRFLAFLPGVVAMMLIYLRTRRLAPLIVAHWPMDISAPFFTIKF